MLKRYTFNTLIYYIYCFIRTKMVSSKIRLIRFPIDLRYRKFIEFGEGFTTGVGCRLEVEKMGNNLRSNEKRLIFGKGVQINDYVHITAAEKVIIEDNVLIASKVYISDCSHGSYGINDIHDSPKTIPKDRKVYSSPVIIRENVWIGENVAILKGVEIGYGSIIGANSVVSKSIPANCIAVGIPAKVIKEFNYTTNKWE